MKDSFLKACYWNKHVLSFGSGTLFCSSVGARYMSSDEKVSSKKIKERDESDENDDEKGSIKKGENPARQAFI
jgi:hypothetical protein